MVDKKENSKLIETITKLIDINKIPKIDLKDIKIMKHYSDYRKGIYKGNHVIISKIFDEDLEFFVHDQDFIFSKLHHECIPEFYGVIIDREEIGAVHKYVSGKSLEDIKLTDFEEEQKIKVIKSLSNALSYIHSNNFIHGSLNSDNIIVDSNCNIFLINFGIGKLIEEYLNNAVRNHTRINFNFYFCFPDIADLIEYDSFEVCNMFTSKVDIWAFGCIVSFLFSEKKPWCNVYHDNKAIIFKLLMTKKPFPVPIREILKKECSCTVEITEIITKCTTSDQTKISMAEIKAITDIL